MDDWGKFVKEQKEIDLKKIISDENLNEEETRKFLDNAFRDGQVKTNGTDIEKILPPMKRFGGGNRTERKQTIIDFILGNVTEVDLTLPDVVKGKVMKKKKLN